MTSLTRNDALWVLNLGDDENRFSPDWITKTNEHLDEIAHSSEPAALLTTGSGKFFSNGLDLDWLGAHAEEYSAYVDSVHALLARFLTLPVPTVAAVNGHAFGAGAMLAMAHDTRIMRTERGYFCFPEVDIHIPFTAPMAALVMCKLTPQAAVASMTTGRRFNAVEAAATGLIDGTADIDELAHAAATSVLPYAGKDRATLGAIKSTMFAGAHQALMSGGA